MPNSIRARIDCWARVGRVGSGVEGRFLWGAVGWVWPPPLFHRLKGHMDGLNAVNISRLHLKVMFQPCVTATSNGGWVLVEEVKIVKIQIGRVPRCVPLHLHPSCHPHHHYQEAPHFQLGPGKKLDLGKDDHLNELSPSDPYQPPSLMPPVDKGTCLKPDFFPFCVPKNTS